MCWWDRLHISDPWAPKMFLVRCYKHPIFHKMSISIPGIIRSWKVPVSGGCVENWLCVYNSWPLFRNYLLPIVGTSLIQTQIVTITQTEIEHVKTETQNCYKYIKDYNISGKDMDIHIQDTKKTTQDLFNYATFLVFVTRSNSFSSVQVIWEAWKVLSL